MAKSPKDDDIISMLAALGGEAPVEPPKEMTLEEELELVARKIFDDPAIMQAAERNERETLDRLIDAKCTEVLSDQSNSAETKYDILTDNQKNLFGTTSNTHLTKYECIALDALVLEIAGMHRFPAENIYFLLEQEFEVPKMAKIKRCDYERVFVFLLGLKIISGGH